MASRDSFTSLTAASARASAPACPLAAGGTPPTDSPLSSPAMNVLIIGGTGLISTGIVKHLHARGDAKISMLNRGQRENTLQSTVRHISGDRNDIAAFERQFQSEQFDVVIDMICFTPQQAESDVRVF